MKVRAEIKSVYNGYTNPLRAIAAIIIDDCFIIKPVRLVEGTKGLFVSMPSRVNTFGEHIEQCHPITAECKALIDEAVITAYEEFMPRI